MDDKMFKVTTKSPMDNRWYERESEIEAAAGRLSDGSGADLFENGFRDHSWDVLTLEEAVAMKSRLEKVDGVTATID